MPNDAVGAAGLAEELENEFNRAANLLVGIDQHAARLLSVDVSDGQREAQLSALGLIAFAALEARANEMKLGLGHGSFESKQKLIVEVGRIVATVLVDEQSASHGADLEHPMPIAAGARQTRGFQGEDRADFAQRDIGHQRLEIFAIVGLGAGEAQVLIQHPDPVALPAQLQGSVLESVLPGGALLVVAHLAHGRLTQIDVSHLLVMVGLDLGYHERSAAAEIVVLGWLATSFAES